jgi:hypothetical protein
MLVFKMRDGRLDGAMRGKTGAFVTSDVRVLSAWIFCDLLGVIEHLCVCLEYSEVHFSNELKRIYGQYLLQTICEL